MLSLVRHASQLQATSNKILGPLNIHLCLEMNPSQLIELIT
jgi:hypothetical protein